ncbi:MAG TPA: DUF1883 domain-containing protein [Solirubrobacterales bacterium]|nr:DUF1883 domain-containing protein [Solirubrobacterales bacterium]
MNGDFTHYDLGQQPKGSTVIVMLQGNSANVRLLDGPNFSSFRNGRPHRYVGGLAKRSPVNLGVPSSGHWHLVVDLMGLGGSVRSSVRIEPPPPQPLPPIREAGRPVSPLGRIVENVDAISPEAEKAYDVFVSHASEDKDGFVRDLALALRRRGLEVWYDEFALRVGDSLRRKIDAGVLSSRFGVVVLSPSFFAKNWPQYELDGLVTREMGGDGQIILPIWHNVSQAEVANYSPALADKVALNSGDADVEEIASEIAEVVAAPD